MKSRIFSLRKKLLIVVLTTSSFVALLATTFSVWVDYQTEHNRISEVIKQLKITSLEPLALSVWDFNDGQIESQLSNILILSEVKALRLRYSDTPQVKKEKILQDKDVQITNDWITFEVQHTEDGKKHLLGYLDVQADFHAAYERTQKKVIYYILFQLVSMGLLSILLLITFQKLVTDKIEQFIFELNSVDLRKINLCKRIKINPSFKLVDEFSLLARAINHLTFSAAKYNEYSQVKLSEAEKNLRMEQAKSVNASKMASLGEMAGGVAHEINNPLAIILGKSTILERMLSKPVLEKEKMHDAIDKINKNADRIARIVKGLRRFSRNAENDPYELVNLNEIMNEVMDLCFEKLKHGNISLEVVCPEDLSFDCRSTEIAQVLLNLISNASDAIEKNEDKWIQVSAAKNKGTVTIKITDSGSGIPKEIAEKIMQPFFTTKEVGKGTGLGLSISQGIIQHHGGKFYINEQSPNTQFVIELPEAQSELKRAS